MAVLSICWGGREDGRLDASENLQLGPMKTPQVGVWEVEPSEWNEDFLDLGCRKWVGEHKQYSQSSFRRSLCYWHCQKRNGSEMPHLWRFSSTCVSVLYCYTWFSPQKKPEQLLVLGFAKGSCYTLLFRLVRITIEHWCWGLKALVRGCPM